MSCCSLYTTRSEVVALLEWLVYFGGIAIAISTGGGIFPQVHVCSSRGQMSLGRMNIQLPTRGKSC